MMRFLIYVTLILGIIESSWANTCNITGKDSEASDTEPISCSASPWIYNTVLETPEKIGRIIKSEPSVLKNIRTNTVTCGYTRSTISRVEITKARYFKNPSHGDRMYTPAETCLMTGVEFIVDVEGASMARAGCPVVGSDSGTYVIKGDFIYVYDVLDCDLNVWKPRTPEEQDAYIKRWLAKIRSQYTEIESTCTPMRVRTKWSSIYDIYDIIFDGGRYTKSSRCFLELNERNDGTLYEDDSSHQEVGKGPIVARIQNGQEICAFKHKKWNYYLYTLSTSPQEVSYFPGELWSKCWINGRNLKHR